MGIPHGLDRRVSRIQRTTCPARSGELRTKLRFQPRGRNNDQVLFAAAQMASFGGIGCRDLYVRPRSGSPVLNSTVTLAFPAGREIRPSSSASSLNHALIPTTRPGSIPERMRRPSGFKGRFGAVKWSGQAIRGISPENPRVPQPRARPKPNRPSPLDPLTATC